MLHNLSFWPQVKSSKMPKFRIFLIVCFLRKSKSWFIITLFGNKFVIKKISDTSEILMLIYYMTVKKEIFKKGDITHVTISMM